jgi:hypothetical protein
MVLSVEEKLRRKEERRLKRWNETHKIIDGIDHKKCNYCHEYKPATTEKFHKAKTSDGLQGHCKDCCNVKFWIWKEEFPEKYEKQKKDRVSRDDPMRLIRSREAAERNRKEGYQKKWRQDNRNKLKEYNYNHLHKVHEISKEEWGNCKLYFNSSCAYCGIDEELAREEQGHRLHMEHAINQGANDLSNCIPACRSCNSQKWERDYDEWYTEENPKFDKLKLDKINKWFNGDYLKYKEQI